MDYYNNLYIQTENGLEKLCICEENQGDPFAEFEGMKYVTWANGTDEEIAMMLKAHYAGYLNIADYWSVGDKRVVHVNALPTTSTRKTAVNAQDEEMIIIDFNHDDLLTPINGVSKAAITVVTGKTLQIGYWYGRQIYFGYNNTYADNPQRDWFNSDFVNTMPAGFGALIKTVVKKSFKTHTSDNMEVIDTKDKCFMLSVPELLGNVTNSKYKNGVDTSNAEGFQYEYFKTAANRKVIDYRMYWLRSPYSAIHNSLGYEVAYINLNGVLGAGGGTGGYNTGSATNGLILAFAM